MARVKDGDLIAIPLNADKIALGVILFQSKYFQSGIILGLLPQLLDVDSTVDVENLDLEFIATPNYTSKRCIGKDGWYVLGNIGDKLKDIPVPELRVSDYIYHKDDVVRNVDYEEFGKYTQLLGQGCGSVEGKLKRHFNL